jgi:hypothetical protein
MAAKQHRIDEHPKIAAHSLSRITEQPNGNNVITMAVLQG